MRSRRGRAGDGGRRLRQSRSRAGRRPGRWAEAPTSVGGEAYGGIGAIEVAVPQLARHLLVVLVQPLAVVRELAAPDEVTVAEVNLAVPVGVREALTRGGDDVGLAALENAL